MIKIGYTMNEESEIRNGVDLAKAAALIREGMSVRHVSCASEEKLEDSKLLAEVYDKLVPKRYSETVKVLQNVVNVARELGDLKTQKCALMDIIDLHRLYEYHGELKVAEASLNDVKRKMKKHDIEDSEDDDEDRGSADEMDAVATKPVQKRKEVCVVSEMTSIDQPVFEESLNVGPKIKQRPKTVIKPLVSNLINSG
jgi:hypothetical protein